MRNPDLSPPPEGLTLSPIGPGDASDVCDVFVARLGSEAGNPSFAAPAAQTLLLAAAAAGLALPNSCRNGTCRTCLCRLHEGSVNYRIAWPGLSADEKREGFVLPCVAYPASDVVLDWGF